MPIKTANNLPARATLDAENIFVIDESHALHQDIRPLEVAILNLMPNKIATETQLARLLGNTPLQVNPTLITTETYRPSNISEKHLGTFYRTWSEICDRKFDGLIITGAPVELMDWEDIAYWEELKKIFEWSLRNVWSSFFICWSAQAALQYFYNIPKYELPKKSFGVFQQKTLKPHSMLLRGFDNKFWVPVSRHTEVRRQDVEKIKNLEILSESEESGLYIVSNKNTRQLFVFNHSEYDPETLNQEYCRDAGKNKKIKVPSNYFPNDDPTQTPITTWRAHANLLFSNWLNYYVYQTTPYKLEKM